MQAIIPQPIVKQQQLSWQRALRDMITDPLELLSLLALSPNQISWQWDKNFPLRVTRSFVARMQKGDPHDPLLKQVLSLKLESQSSEGYTDDPLKESLCNPVPGLLHKFKSRVLLTFTSSCAIHCRYCFRRDFPYEENNPGRKGWGEALAYIANHPEIFEVILSGGDPLMAQDEALSSFFAQLEEIPHIQLLRIHTRLPVVIPARISREFLKMIRQTRFNIVMVYHINHPNEIIPAIKQGVMQLKQQHITVLNQSVLLKGVNDSAKCLKALSLKLFDAGILPYYVNMLDPIQGASHFSLPLADAQQLQQELRACLPGYLVPKFVQEIPHQPNKIPVDRL